MKLKPRFDVIVVGSGPAGCVAAKKCAQSGLNTLCQEYVCPGCGALLPVDVLCPELESEQKRILWDIQLEV